MDNDESGMSIAGGLQQWICMRAEVVGRLFGYEFGYVLVYLLGAPVEWI